ncbi:MAG: hypothetical protein K2K72_04750 [Duncaniella sp.]|nr:hypothetical protein [Duncaniella sp.]
MKLNRAIIRQLSKEAGRNVNTPEGAAYLRNDIESVTGERVSLNTIKRLTGVIEYNGHPRESTLDIIARYLGYESYSTMIDNTQLRGSAISYHFPFISLRALPIGTLVSFTWDPNRFIAIRHLGNGQYSVEQSINGKLQVGDILTTYHICNRYPFMVDNVVRNGESIGSYIAGAENGISLFDIVKPEG